MRYGTVPVVRATGGLANTVVEGLNGFVFEAQGTEALQEAIHRACVTFGTPEWDKLVQAGMRGNYSWERSARAYASLFDSVVSSRRAAIPA
jgi:starch synthase